LVSKNALCGLKRQHHIPVRSGVFHQGRTGSNRNCAGQRSVGCIIRAQISVSHRRGKEIIHENRNHRLRQYRSRVAANLVANGESVIVAARDQAKAQALAQKLRTKAEATSIKDALKKADILVLGMWFDTIKEFIGANRASLVGKIIIDPSNPIAPDGKGGFKKIIPADQSSGQIISKLLPEGAELVKAFCSVSVQSLEAGANRKPELAVLFLCDRLSGSRRGGRKIDSREWFRACQRRGHQPIHPHRSIRRS
jgi:hypothetical protein